LARRLPESLNAVRNRGDLLRLSRLRTLFLPALAADNATEARRELDSCMSQRPEARCSIQDFNQFYAELHILLYRGDAVAAWERMMEEARIIRRSLILHAQLARGLFYEVRARCVLAVAVGWPILSCSSALRSGMRAAWSGNACPGWTRWLSASAPGSPPCEETSPQPQPSYAAPVRASTPPTCRYTPRFRDAGSASCWRAGGA